MSKSATYILWAHMRMADPRSVGDHRIPLATDVLEKYAGKCPSSKELRERRKRDWEKFWRENGSVIPVDI